MAAPSQSRIAHASGLWLLALPAVASAVLAAFPLIPWVRSNPRLSGSFWGGAVVLLLLLCLLRLRLKQTGREVEIEFVPRAVHYVQMAMHTSIYIYWGWYWREVYHYAPLIVAQIVFVYALDMLICWWRRETWILGFGPIPIVLSTNLFLWFKDDWFFLQFLLISTGVLCKELVVWTRDGRRTHVFNPSAIGLAIFSLALLLTHSTQISWAEEVAVTLGRPPDIYIEIFLLGLIVQALFSVTLVTLSAAAILYLLSSFYTRATGLYYFVDSNIPAAVFLGLHLLVTDPATSPRKNLGKVIFGASYGVAVFGLYSLLGVLGFPTFYDKLLCVPLLNLTVRRLDRISVAAETWLRSLRWRARISIARWSPRTSNFAHMSVWTSLFAIMVLTGFLGGRHPGSDPEFWRLACAQGRGSACQTWSHTLDVSCGHGSARACFDLAAASSEGVLIPKNSVAAAKDFGRSCDMSLQQGCARLVRLVAARGPGALRDACDSSDGESCFILASLYYAGRGVPADSAQAVSLFQRSCESGWPRGCGGLGECYRSGQGTPANSALAITYFERACRGGIAASCFAAGTIYRSQHAAPLAKERFQEACDLSVRYAIASTAYFAARASNTPEKTSPLCAEAER